MSPPPDIDRKKFTLWVRPLLIFSLCLIPLLLPRLSESAASEPHISGGSDHDDAFSDPAEPLSRFQLGIHHFIHGRSDMALELFEQLFSHYRELGEWGRWMEVAGYVGLIHRERRDSGSARELAGQMESVVIQYLSEDDPRRSIHHLLNAQLATEELQLERALREAELAIHFVVDQPDFEELTVRGWSVLGYIYDVRGDYLQAVEAYRKGIEWTEYIKSRESRLYMITRVNNNLGVALRKAGRYGEAMERYRLNSDYLLQLYDEDHPEVARNLNNIGTVLFRDGDILSAVVHFIQAANTFEEHYGKDHISVAAAWNNAGTALLKLEDHDEAMRYLERALEIKIRLSGEEHLETAIGYSNLASAYAGQGDLEVALDYYNRSLEIRKQSFGSRHPDLIRPLLNRARHHIRMKSPEQAIADLEQVIEVAEDRLEADHPDLAEAWIEMGRAYQLNLDDEEAAVATQRALVALIDGFSDMDLFVNPVRPASPHMRLVLTALSIKAEVVLEMGRNRQSMTLIGLAADTYQVAVELLEELRSEFRHEMSKLNLNDEFSAVFEGALLANWLLYQHSGDPVMAEKALIAVERGKSRIASELLQASKIREAGVPEEIRREEQMLKREIALGKKRLLMARERGDDRDDRRFLELQNDLIRAHRQLHDWEGEMEMLYPQLKEAVHRRDPPDLQQIQTSLLKEGQIALNYLLGQETSFLVLISRDEVHVTTLPPAGLIATDVEELLSAIRTRDYTRFRTLSHQLYRTLLEPVEEILPHYGELLILPDDLLHYLPFELLLTEPAPDMDATRWSYLINDLSVSYSPSLDVYSNRERAKPFNGERLLAVAPYAESAGHPLISGGEGMGDVLPPLPLSGYEVEESARIFEQSGRSLLPFRNRRRADLLISEQATLERVMERPLEEYGYIHLATHATINGAFPELSGIRFAGSDGSGERTLYLGDVATMNFNTDLMVLSACDTGVGPLARGEGMIGFSRAFIQSGVRNLLVTLWKVSDRPTSELMVAFYEEMMAGSDRSEALRRAKRSLIENPATAFPAYWAPFILIGS